MDRCPLGEEVGFWGAVPGSVSFLPSVSQKLGTTSSGRRWEFRTQSKAISDRRGPVACTGGAPEGWGHTEARTTHKENPDHHPSCPRLIWDLALIWATAKFTNGGHLLYFITIVPWSALHIERCKVGAFQVEYSNHLEGIWLPVRIKEDKLAV